MKRFFRLTILASMVLALLATGCKDGAETEDGPQVVTVMDGLSYVDVVVGEGVACAKGDHIVVAYTGWCLVDGEKASEPFDKSPDDKPIKFQVGVGRLIRGWDEGIPGMKVGGKRELTISPENGYGVQAMDKIPANSTLFFEVELLDVIRVEIEDVKVGDGPVAEVGDQLSVHYTGWLYEDGQKKGEPFDSSHTRGVPLEFALGQSRVIQGWHKGIAGMKVGGQRTLIIPPELGYGPREVGGIIPANSTLFFDVELVSIQGK